MKFPIAPESMNAFRLAEKGGEVGFSSCMQAGIKMGFVGDDAESDETSTLHSRSISTFFGTRIGATETEALNHF